MNPWAFCPDKAEPELYQYIFSLTHDLKAMTTETDPEEKNKDTEGLFRTGQLSLWRVADL